jgi:hypothetical protein
MILQLLAAAPNAVPAALGPPDAPPSRLVRSYYSGVRIALRWTNGDAYAYIRVYWNGTYVAQLDPGTVYYESGKTTGTFGVSHYKNGQESEIVSETA